MAFSGRGIVRVDRTHSPEPQLLIRQVNIAAKTPLDEIWTPAPSPLPLPLPLPLHRCVDSDLFSISNLSQLRNVPWLRWGGGSGMGERWSNGGGMLLLYFAFTLLFIIVPMGFLPWEIRVAFPVESHLRQSRATQPRLHAGCFSVSIIHRTQTWTTGSLTCAQM